MIASSQPKSVFNVHNSYSSSSPSPSPTPSPVFGPSNLRCNPVHLITPKMSSKWICIWVTSFVYPLTGFKMMQFIPFYYFVIVCLSAVELLFKRESRRCKDTQRKRLDTLKDWDLSETWHLVNVHLCVSSLPWHQQVFSLLFFYSASLSPSLSLSWLAKSSVVHSRRRQRNGVCNKRHEQELMISLVINCVFGTWVKEESKEEKEGEKERESEIRYSLLGAFILRSLGWSSRAAQRTLVPSSLLQLFFHVQ